MPAAPKPTTGKSKAAGQKYFIDFSGPAADGILDAAGFEKFLHDRIKVDGKAGQLGDVVKVQREGECRRSAAQRPKYKPLPCSILTLIPASVRSLRSRTRRGQDQHHDYDPLLEALPQVPHQEVPQALSAP